MWMRLVRSHGLTSDKISTVVENYRREDLSVIEQSPGFQGIALGENPQAGSIGSVSFWEDEQAMRDSERFSVKARERALVMFEVEDPILTDHFEITYSNSLDPVAGAPARPRMRVVRFTGLDPDAIDLAAESYREDAEHRLQSTRGAFRAAIGVNRAAGTIAVVSFWVSERDMRDAERVSVEVREQAVSAASVRRIPRVDHFHITIASGLDHLTVRERAPEAPAPEAPAPDLAAVQVPPAEPELQVASVPGLGVFARITRHLGLSAERVASTTRDIDQTQLPIMEAEPGFVGALILADHIGGESIGITLWQSEAAMHASEAAAARVREAIQSNLGEEHTPVVLRCELIDHRPWTFDRDATPYARFHRHPGLTPEKLAPRAAELEQRHIPRIADEPGFAGALIFTSVSETQLLGLTLWESAAMMRRSEAVSRSIRAELDVEASGWERVTVAHTEVVANRHFVGDRVTARG